MLSGFNFECPLNEIRKQREQLDGCSLCFVGALFAVLYRIGISFKLEIGIASTFIVLLQRICNSRFYHQPRTRSEGKSFLTALALIEQKN
jgi:hypothetical protein